MAKLKKVGIDTLVHFVMDTEVSTKMENLAKGWTALVSEVVVDDIVAGTILYVPGVDYKTLKKR